MTPVKYKSLTKCKFCGLPARYRRYKESTRDFVSVCMACNHKLTRGELRL